MEVKIEKGVPIPAPEGQPVVTSHPELQKMSVGDSAFYAGVHLKAEGESKRAYHKLQGAIQREKKSRRYQFVTRTLTEGGVLGMRVWRTK